MAALKEDGYSNSDLKQFYSIPVLEIFKSHTWSKNAFKKPPKTAVTNKILYYF